STRELGRDRRWSRRGRTGHVGEEVVSLDELHREVQRIVGRDKLVQPNEVGMHDVCKAAELAFEAIDRLRLLAREDLHRDPRTELRVDGLVDGAECPRADPTLERQPSPENLRDTNPVHAAHHAMAGCGRVARIRIEVPGTVDTELLDLKEGEGVVFGRAPDGAALREPELRTLRTHITNVPSVSSTHAVVWLREQRIHMRDLGSRNGSWLRLPV